MASYLLSRRAASDLEEIADFTIKQFGIAQARQYRDQFETCFDNLANNPGLGRPAVHLAKGLRRFEHQSHIVFYRRRQDGLLIERILHVSMDVQRHF
jgi:toxin ParE1/3/4